MGAKAERNRKNAYQARLLLLVSLLLAAALLVSTMIYVYFEGLLDRQTYQFYSLSLKNAGDAAQAIQDSIKEVFDQMTFDNQLSLLLNYKTRSATDLLAGLKRLNAYAYANGFIDSVCLFNALDDTYYISSEHAPQAVQKPGELFDQELAKIVEEYWRYDNMEPISRTVTVSYPKIETLSFVTYLRYNTLAAHGESSVVAVNVPSEAFLRQISLAPESEQTRVEVVDGKGMLMLGTQGTAHQDLSGRAYVQQVLSAKADLGYFKTAYQNQAEIIFYQRIAGGYWTLIYAVGEQAIASLFSLPQKTATVFLLIACLALLLAVIALLIRRMVADYKAQMAKLEQAREDQHVLEDQRRQQTLLNLLSASQVLTAQEIARAMEASAVAPTPAKRFQLVLFLLDAYEEFCQHSDLNEVALAKRQICELVREQLADQGLIFAVPLEAGQVVALCQPDGEQSLHSCLARILHHSPRSLSALISQPFEDLRDLSASFRWGQDALCYKQLYGSGSIMTGREIEEREVTEVSLPEAKLKALTGDIMSLDMDKAEEEAKELIKEISAGSCRSFHVALIQLLAALDDALVVLLSNNSATLKGGAQLFGIPRMDSAQDMTQALCACLRSVEKAVLEKKESRHDDLVAHIDELIDQGFSDRDFTAAALCESTGLSQAYLSRLYKKYKGVTPTEAIWDRRMDKARKMLLETEQQVTVIAEQCGFSEGPYFYKAFKKAHGVTPNAYRLSRRGEQGQ